MKIYTRTGDAGRTSLYKGGQVEKTDSIVHLNGEIDELNSFLGLAVTLSRVDKVKTELEEIQKYLFVVGADVAASQVKKVEHRSAIVGVTEDAIQGLEEKIDLFNAALPKIRSFVLPGGSQGGASIQVARAICRRVERSAWVVIKTKGMSPIIARWLNRCSDWLYILAKTENNESGVEETPV